MKSRRIWSAMMAAGGMLVLIVDTQTAISGVQSGIELCLKTLIPSLFPFFILSALLTGNLLGSRSKLLRPIGRLCGIPEGAESLLAVGFLGGYPVGARNAALAYRSGSISETDAARMIAVCNNAGPAFLFGIVGAAFDSPVIPWALWIIHIMGALLAAMAVRPEFTGGPARVPAKSLSLPAALNQSLHVMAQVCGWVIVFRMILVYLDRWFLWLLPQDLKIILSGILELSNGCVQLCNLENEGLRFVASSVMLALGGLCVSFQTSSVASGLSLKYYFPGKLLHAAVSFLMALLMQPLLPVSQKCTVHPGCTVLVLLLAIIVVHYLRRYQKSSSIPLSIGV